MTTVAEPIRRILRGRRRREWHDLATDYLMRPELWWGADAPRHVEKVHRKLRAIAVRDGLGRTDIVDAVVAMATKRRIQRPTPVFVTGLGGSGSHWLTAMLSDATDLVGAGEVYLPRALLDELAGLSEADQACAVDAIHVLHAWPRSADVWALGTVNCAAGVGMLARYRQWFPDAVGVHLRRDPRDQVLSVTFRKPAYRRATAPDATDAEYLRRMMRRNVTAYRQYLEARPHITVECRYEALVDDPRPALERIVSALGRPVDRSRIERAAATHDAARIRSQGADGPSNLDAGGRSRGWQHLEDPARLRTLHAGLIDAICGLEYAPGDCMGTHLPDPALPARTFTFSGRPPGALYRRMDGTWLPLDTRRSAISIDAGTPVLLRIGAEASTDLRVLRERGPGDVQALCLAGNDRVDDDGLAHLATMTDLRTLDLAGTGVTDTGLVHVEALANLEQINLADTATTPAGRTRLAGALPQLTTWT